jgi:hypothetical protein
MSALTPIHEVGLTVLADPSGLKLRGLSALAPEQRQQIVEYVKANKVQILTALSQAGEPGQCESCPAADYAGHGPQCFHYAYYLGKSGKPKPCAEVRKQCPRE